jgi:hypothetical protein
MFTNYIPTTRFNVITVTVVLATFVTGILLPDIEFILGIVSRKKPLKYVAKKLILQNIALTF